MEALRRSVHCTGLASCWRPALSISTRYVLLPHIISWYANFFRTCWKTYDRAWYPEGVFSNIWLTHLYFYIQQINKANSDPEYTPGNIGFDPLGLYPKDVEGQKKMLAKELRNGRLAMIAITAFAAQEFVTNTGVVDQTPFFFKFLGGMV